MTRTPRNFHLGSKAERLTASISRPKHPNDRTKILRPAVFQPWDITGPAQVSQPGLADSGYFRALIRTFSAFLVSRSAA
jgi:hypothetical protein